MIDNDNVNDNLIENNEQRRDSSFYENELNNYISEHDGEKIKEDIKLLHAMGYDMKMINKVYILLQPPNIERADEYMSEIGGIYQHDFFENHNAGKNKDLCFICQKPKKFHLDYILEEFLVGIDNNDINNDNQNNIAINISNNINNNNKNSNNNDSFDFDYKIEEEKDDNNINVLSLNKNTNDFSLKKPFNKECRVCFDEIPDEEIEQNSLPCNHICCTQCWNNYFKTLISDAKVEEIKCIEHDCKEIIPEEFIFKFIQKDKKLMSKYAKFKLRAEIIKDPNKKQCPKPDCDSYLEKSPTSRYVKCKKGHQFCFECLRAPHGNNSCDKVLEKDFLKWKKNKIIKKCPRCQIFTEKNEGCNHMTCTSCKYQWCWLCLGPYSYGHYNSGACKGHQFTKANNLIEAKKGIRSVHYDYHVQNQKFCCFTLYTIFPFFYHGYNEPIRLFSILERYLAIFVMWFFGYFLFAGFTMINYTEDRIEFDRLDCPYYVLGFLMAICLFVSFQILFTCLITPFILIALFYPYFIDNILMFLDINI